MSQNSARCRPEQRAADGLIAGSRGARSKSMEFDGEEPVTAVGQSRRDDDIDRIAQQWIERRPDVLPLLERQLNAIEERRNGHGVLLGGSRRVSRSRRKHIDRDDILPIDRHAKGRFLGEVAPVERPLVVPGRTLGP